jgi:hypothetical protein
VISKGIGVVADQLAKQEQIDDTLAANKAVEFHRRQNIEEQARVQTAIEKNRKGAREAVRTGNYEGFINKGFRDRQIIQDSFKVTTARAAAEQDWDEKYEEIIRTAPAGADLNALVEEQLEADLEGAEPLFDVEYANTIAAHAGKAMDLKRTQDTKLAILQVDETNQVVAARTLKQESFSPDVGSLENLTAELASTYNAHMSGTAATLKAQAVIDSQLAEAAVARPSLVSLLTDPQKSRGGTSFAERNPHAYEAALKAATAREGQLSSLAAKQDLESLQTRIGLLGSPDNDDSIHDIWLDAIGHEDIHGSSNDWQSTMAAINKKRAAVSKDFSALNHIYRTGEAPALTNPNYANTMLMGWQNQANVTDEQNVNFLTALAKTGPGTKLQQMWARDIQSGGQRAVDRANQTKIFMDAHGQPADHYLSADEAAIVDGYVFLTENKAIDQAQAMASLREGGEGSNWQDHYKNRLNDPSITGNRTGSGVLHGERARNTVASEVFDASLGEHPDHDSDWETQGPVVQQIFTDSVDMASFLLRNQEHSEGDIETLAVELAHGKVWHALKADGTLEVTKNMVPPGTEVFRADTAERFQVASEEAFEEGGFIGSPTRAYSDRGTLAGGGLMVETQVGNLKGPRQFTPGQKFLIPVSELENMPWLKNFLDVKSIEGRGPHGLGLAITRVPTIDPGSFHGAFSPRQPIGNKGHFLTFNREENRWQNRYEDIPPPPEAPVPITIEELSERSKAQREAERAAPFGDDTSFLGGS